MEMESLQRSAMPRSLANILKKPIMSILNRPPDQRRAAALLSEWPGRQICRACRQLERSQVWSSWYKRKRSG